MGDKKIENNGNISNYYSGLSGLELPVPKYLFPDEHRNSSRLTYYSTFFNSIEINSTFYKLPQERTIARWVQEVPADFKFTFKLSQTITHEKELVFKEEDIALFFRVISPAAAKNGCLLIQFPPGLGKVNMMQLDSLLRCIAQADPGRTWQPAVEFRNKSWYVEEVYELLASYRAALVIQDMPKSAGPLLTYLSDFVYLRFHGPSGNYRGSYADHVLAEYAGYVKEWIGEGKKVFTYFNNTAGDAFRDLETMNGLVYTAIRNEL
jgi:uncharacterized protein YecE (DUF72 family)